MTTSQPTHIPQSTEIRPDDSPTAISSGEFAGTPSESLPTNLPEIPGYRIVDRLGRGGMGVVYLAHHEELGRPAAIKLLNAGADQKIIERFRTEARAAANLQHAHIAQLYENGEADGQPWLALEFVAGGTLAQHIDSKPQRPRDAAKMMEQIARAVHACHSAGILHRDLKPANVLLTIDGEPKVTDFGLARWVEGGNSPTRTGDIMGTAAYMAPEQASGVVRNLGPACDVYALGAVLYEMLTGRPPFQSPDPLSTLRLVLTEEPVRPRRLQPGVPRDLETICLKCLEKTPKRRYASADAVADDLARFLDNRPIQARRTSIWERGIKWARRRPALAALMLVVLLSTIVVVSGAVWYGAQLARANSDLTKSNTELAQSKTDLEKSNSDLAAQNKRNERLLEEDRGLINWVLFDHEKSLAEIPRAKEARKALVDRMLKYVQRLAREAEDNTRLAPEVAVAYERIAGVLGHPNLPNLSRVDEALATINKAIVWRKKLYEADRNSPSRTIMYAGALAKRGDIEWALADYRAAETSYLEADRLAKSKSAVAGKRKALLQLQVSIDEGLASVAAESGNPAKAEKAARAALASADACASAKGLFSPNEITLLRARALDQLGLALESAEKRKEAIPRFREALSLLDGIPENYRVRLARVESLMNLAHTLIAAQTSLPKAEQHLRRALDIIPQAERDYGVNLTVRKANALGRLGQALRGQARWEAAAAEFGKAYRLTSGINPKSPVIRRNQLIQVRDYAEALGVTGRLGDALFHLERSIPVGETLLKESTTPYDAAAMVPILDLASRIRFSQAGGALKRVKRGNVLLDAMPQLVGKPMREGLARILRKQDADRVIQAFLGIQRYVQQRNVQNYLELLQRNRDALRFARWAVAVGKTMTAGDVKSRIAHLLAAAQQRADIIAKMLGPDDKSQK